MEQLHSNEQVLTTHRFDPNSSKLVFPISLENGRFIPNPMFEGSLLRTIRSNEVKHESFVNGLESLSSSPNSGFPASRKSDVWVSQIDEVKQTFIENGLESSPSLLKSVSPEIEKFDVWVGEIDELKEESVVVSFYDRDDDIPSYQAEFDIKAYFKGDQKLLREGAYVRWEIAYANSLENSPIGDNVKFSVLRVIEFPQITESDWENALKEADELLDGFFDYDPTQ